MDDLPETVELTGSKGALKLRIVPPGSLAVRTSLGYAVASHDSERVYLAALWHCCSAIRQHVRDPGRTAALGLAVLEWLLAEGVPFVQAVNAGQVAWLWCVRGLPDWEAAKATEGFTDPSTGGSTT